MSKEKSDASTTAQKPTLVLARGDGLSIDKVLIMFKLLIPAQAAHDYEMMSPAITE